MKAIICGGGTVGHLTPGISIAEIIKKNDKNSKILFVSRAGGTENDVILKSGFDLQTIKIEPLIHRITLKNFSKIKTMISALKEAKKILNDFSPDVVIGTGGYVCWPMLRAAQKMKIPTVIHESNLCPGAATRFLAGKSSKVLLNFRESEKHFKKKNNLITVGNPLPDSFSSITRDEARRKLGLTQKDFFILSFGGSGGAEKINETVIELMKSYSSQKKEIVHVHASGKRYLDKIKEENPLFVNSGYNGCKIVPFINNMALYMKAADTVISRCGAMTLSEIAHCQTAPILIPSPNVTGNHQYKNAKMFTDVGAALMIEESELNARTLIDAVRYLAMNKGVREKIKKQLSSFKCDDTKKNIYSIIEEVIKKS